MLMRDKLSQISVGTDSEKTLFVSAFDSLYDMEVVALIVAWLSNGVANENIVTRNIVEKVMNNQPSLFVRNIDETLRDGIIEDACVCGLMTTSHLCTLLEKIKAMKSMQDEYLSHMERAKDKCKYSHDALAMMFSGGTGFPTRASSSTFYRFNLFFYWMAYKFRLWQVPTQQALLPCNDKILERAYNLGIVKTPVKSNIANTIALTKKARSYFGDNDFYKLYEILEFYNE